MEAGVNMKPGYKKKGLKRKRISVPPKLQLFHNKIAMIKIA